MKLSSEQLDTLTVRLPQWTLTNQRGGTFQRSFAFHDLAPAHGFMSQVAVHAERMKHHPEWSNVYNSVDVVLTTHDVQGDSQNDIDTGLLMDRIAASIAALSQ